MDRPALFVAGTETQAGRQDVKVGMRAAQFGLILLCLVGSLVSFRLVDHLVAAKAQRSFESVATDGRFALTERLERFKQMSDGLSGLFAASETVTARELKLYVEQLEDAAINPGLTGVGYIEEVPRQLLGDFLDDARIGGSGEIIVHPETDAELLYLVKFAEPVQGAYVSVGYDIGSVARLRETALASRLSDQALLTPQLGYLGDQQTETAAGPGFLLMNPVYRHATEAADTALHGAFQGWIYLGISARGALDDLTPSQGQQYELSVYSSGSTGAERLIYSSTGIGPLQGRYESSFTFEQFGQAWTARWVSTPAFEAAQPTEMPSVALACGIVMTALVTMLLRAGALREQQVKRQVEEKVRELKTTSEEIRAMVDNALIGIATLDSNGVVLRCNESGLMTLGLEAQDVIGRPMRAFLPDIDLRRVRGHLTRRLACGDRRVIDVQISRWQTGQGTERITLFMHDITEEQALQAKLRETERRWGLALQGANIGVFDINLMTGKSQVSESWRRIMHVPDDMRPLDSQAFFLERVHPDDLPYVKELDRACLRGEIDRATAQFRVDNGQGEWLWMRSDATVVDRAPDGTALRYVGAQMDITSELENQWLMRASEERFRLIFTNAPVGIGVLGHSMRFTAVNEAMCELLLYPDPLSVIGERHLVRALTKSHLAEIMQEISECRARGGHALHTETELRRHDGSRIWVLLNVSWMTDPQTLEDVFIVQMGDISEKKNIERIKNEFISTVSHELRTPLTSIRGALGLLDDLAKDDLSQSGMRLLEIAQSNTERLIRLVNDILDVERIGSGRMSFDISRESANDVLAESQTEMMPYAQTLGVSLRLMPMEHDVEILTDRARLAQVFLNLISNACKFSDPGGEVRLEARNEGDHVRFLVHDDGPGVPESFRGQIFQRFSQADSSDTRSKGGTGLGLIIAKQLVERMGGEIGYDSEPGQTVFWFTVPLAEESAPRQIG